MCRLNEVTASALSWGTDRINHNLRGANWRDDMTQGGNVTVAATAKLSLKSGEKLGSESSCMVYGRLNSAQIL